ncbi:MAG: SMC-Scp complex subunit ScpB [Planctomycetota bacterium]|nr:SMC-Scp complex subunit ScpB [Planctomycetota bacterium]
MAISGPFASDEPLSLRKLGSLLEEVDSSDIKKAIEELKSEYESTDRAWRMEEVAGGFQLLTRPQYTDTISRLQKAKSDRKLSNAAMETLAIVAYKQPIRRADVESIRGVQSGELLRALMEKDLVKVVGRDTVPGAPVLYGTTKNFLEVCGLKSLKDLPKPEEVK